MSAEIQERETLYPSRESGRRTGYWMEFWKARVGWFGEWTNFGEGNRIGTGTGPLWRPTEAWAKRVVHRRVARMRRADKRRAAAKVMTL